MALKQKVGTLSIAEKYDIIQMIENGETQTTIAEKYNISLRTVVIIKERRAEITEEFQKSSAATSSSTTVFARAASNAKFSTALRQWYIRCRNKNIRVTNEMLATKAREFNKKFRGTSHFKGSKSWVTSYKKRYSFRKTDTNEDLETVNKNEADYSKAQLKNLLQNGEYTLDNVYNADCLGLMWRAVPEKTLLFEASQSKKSPHGEKVLIFLCANATGSHKLPVLIIGTTMNPPCLKSSRDLSTIYKANTKPIMDSKLFNEWFDECFLKSVIERQQKIGHRKKSLLLLDNIATHHERGLVSTKDALVKIMYLSCDAAPLIQPMDRGIIACFKRKYGIELLESLIPTSNSVSEEELIHIYSQLNINDCCRMVHNAWSKVKSPILKNAWDKLLKDESEQSSEDPEIIKKDIDKALKELNKIPGCRGCDSIAVMNWFESNTKHNTDIEVDISSTLIRFINAAMDTEANKPTDENFEDILDDSSP